MIESSIVVGCALLTYFMVFASGKDGENYSSKKMLIVYRETAVEITQILNATAKINNLRSSPISPRQLISILINT